MSDADYYQGHKDDEAEWEDVPVRRRKADGRRLDVVVSVRFGPDDASLVRDAATAAGTNLSAYIRDAAVSSARGFRPVAQSVWPGLVSWDITATAVTCSSGTLSSERPHPVLDAGDAVHDENDQVLRNVLLVRAAG